MDHEDELGFQWIKLKPWRGKLTHNHKFMQDHQYIMREQGLVAIKTSITTCQNILRIFYIQLYKNNGVQYLYKMENISILNLKQNKWSSINKE